MTASPEPSVSKPVEIPFSVIATEAIFEAKIAAQTKGEHFTKSCVQAILEEQWAFWQAAHKPKRRKPGEPPKPRARNALFDVMAEAFKMVLANGTVTKMAAGRIGKVIAELKEADPTLTPDELKRICFCVIRKYEGATPLAVSLHFHEFSKAAKRTPTAKRDIYAEPPPNWRAVAKQLYPGAAAWSNAHDFDRMAWSEVSLVIRPDILKRIP